MPIERTVYGDHGADFELTGYRLGPVPEADRLRAVEILEDAMKPAGHEALVMALMGLYADCSKAKAGTEDVKMLLSRRADMLAEFPGDVAVEVCRKAGRMFRFFPSVSELVDMCEWRTEPRKLKLAALARAPETGTEGRNEDVAGAIAKLGRELRA